MLPWNFVISLQEGNDSSGSELHSECSDSDVFGILLL